MRRLEMLLVLAAAAGCSGRIGDGDAVPGASRPGTGGTEPGTNPGTTPGPTSPGPTNPGPTNPGPTEPPPLPPPPAFAPSAASLHRLTRAQFGRTVRDLLGDVNVPADIEVDTTISGFSTIGASQLAIGPRAAEQYESAALDLAAQVFGDARKREALVGCAPSAANDPCVRAFLERFGRRAWRRPLAAEELDRWSAVVESVSALFRSPWKGLEAAVAGLLESPYFLYRVETGALPDPTDAARRRYDSWEMASRLSYFVWGTTPDDALLDAAARDELSTRDGILAQARRMLDSPRAKDAVAVFFTEYLKLDRLETLNKEAATFPQMSPTLGGSMRREILELLDDIVFARDTDLREMFDSETTFVNAELARLYNLPAPAAPGFSKVQLPAGGPRAGVLTTGGFLALNAHATQTSPTFRGRFIRQFIMCQEIPPPPPGVNTNLPTEGPSGPQTLRQRIESLHLQNATCAGCHNAMDPLGFAFENFDAIGAYRTTDNGLPVDPTGTIDGARFKSARELAAILKTRREVASCLSRMAYRFASGHLEERAEEASIRSVVSAFEGGGYKFKTLVAEVVASDAFRYAARAE